MLRTPRAYRGTLGPPGGVPNERYGDYPRGVACTALKASESWRGVGSLPLSIFDRQKPYVRDRNRVTTESPQCPGTDRNSPDHSEKCPGCLGSDLLVCSS
ncbi:hypothetical protein GCM10009550_19940 [Actinocorallia libanotica]|uniref:Uncharacterized protein n=1 Tax=Actinocorallia libanotica TaxID=46162 RepID=A0ABP4B444_9ACTN